MKCFQGVRREMNLELRQELDLQKWRVFFSMDWRLLALYECRQ